MKTVGLVCPASPLGETPSKEELISYFKNLGFERVVFASHTAQAERYLSGPDELRAKELTAFFKDKSIDVIFALRGGYGSPRLLDKIDYQAIRKNPKPFFGFSDITALQLALYHKANLSSFSGWSLKERNAPILSFSLQKALKKESFSTEITPFNLKAKEQAKKAPPESAPLLGGCLTMISALLGTPYLPSFKESFVVLEDVHEEPFRIDRMLNQLFLSGAFQKIKGLFLGDFSSCIAKDEADGVIQDVLQDYFKKAPFPVYNNLFYGHGKDRLILPLGEKVVLEKGMLTFNLK